MRWVSCVPRCREKGPILWKGSDMAAVPRKPRHVFQLPSKDVCQRVTSSGRAVAPNVSWYASNGSGSRRRDGIRDHDAEFVQFLGSVKNAFFGRKQCRGRWPVVEATLQDRQHETALVAEGVSLRLVEHVSALGHAGFP